MEKGGRFKGGRVKVRSSVARHSESSTRADFVLMGGKKGGGGQCVLEGGGEGQGRVRGDVGGEELGGQVQRVQHQG